MSVFGAESTPKLCDSCSGLCCRAGTRIVLSAEEASFLQRGGTKLRGALLFFIDPSMTDDGAAFAEPAKYELLHDQVRREVCADRTAFNRSETLRQVAELVLAQKPGRQQYVIESDCGYLDTSVNPPKCTVYTDAERPQVCSGFMPGNPHCLNMREAEGLAVSVELTQKPHN